jgi:hypothetical protein
MSDLEIIETRKWTPLSQSIAQANAYSRMLLPHCRYVVAFCHAEKQHLVCLEAAGALTTSPTCHGR